MPCPFARVLILSNFLIVIIIFVIQGRVGFGARDAISLLSPSPEIDELAAVGAEGPMGIIFPLSLTVTCWALDPKRHLLLFNYLKQWRRKALRLRVFFLLDLGLENSR